MITRRCWINVDGTQLAALQCGDPDATPVLFLPGYTGSKEDFAPVLPPLAEAGFFVTSIDQPGQFESPGPSDPAAYTPDALAPVAVQVARTLGAPIHLVGHSFGGLVARAAAIAAPDCLRSLTLMGSGPAAIGGIRLALIDALEPMMADGDLAAVFDAMEAVGQLADTYVEPPPDVAAFRRRRFVSSAPGCVQGMGDAIRTEPDRVAELAKIDLQMLVIHGESDDAWPPPSQVEMARRLNARYVVVPDAAHSPAVENPPLTAQSLVAFWRDADNRDSLVW